MKPLSFLVILFLMALIMACSKKADVSTSVTPGSDSLKLTNTELIAKGWKYQSVDVALPNGDTINTYTRRGANEPDDRLNIFLEKSGAFTLYDHTDVNDIGTWKFTDNETKIVFTGKVIYETRIITQLTYYKWDSKLIYDPSTTPDDLIVDGVKTRVDLSKGATFIFKMIPN